MITSHKVFLVVDCETDGLTNKKRVAVSWENYPRIVELGWLIVDQSGNGLVWRDYLIKPRGFEIPSSASKHNGITQTMALVRGVEPTAALRQLLSDVACFKPTMLVAHNVEFDRPILVSEVRRHGFRPAPISSMETFWTVKWGVPAIAFSWLRVLYPLELAQCNETRR